MKNKILLFAVSLMAGMLTADMQSLVNLNHRVAELEKGSLWQAEAICTNSALIHTNLVLTLDTYHALITQQRDLETLKVPRNYAAP